MREQDSKQGIERSVTKKEQIVEAAFRLFNANGFYATGVDLIMREAQVSKRTLYKYFSTKNELIVAALQYYWTIYRAKLDRLIDFRNRAPRDNIQAIFEDAKTWFVDNQFHGCLAVNAMGEFSGKDSAIEDSCRRFKQWEIQVLTQLTVQLTDKQPEQLAYKLFVLLEGMSAVAQVSHGAYPVDMTAMAEQVIDQHLC